MTLSYGQYQTALEAHLEDAFIAAGVDPKSFIPLSSIEDIDEAWLPILAVDRQAQLWTPDVGTTQLRRNIIKTAKKIALLRGTDAAFEEYGKIAGFTASVNKIPKANDTTPIILDFYITVSSYQDANSVAWSQWVIRALNYLIGSDVRLGTVYFIAPFSYSTYRQVVVRAENYKTL